MDSTKPGPTETELQSEEALCSSVLRAQRRGLSKVNLHDWLFQLALLFHPILSKTKINHNSFADVFPHFASTSCMTPSCILWVFIGSLYRVCSHDVTGAMLEEWNILLGIELYFYANSSFVSLCKYGFWSHERTHSIVRTHFRCAPSANTKAAVIIFPISGDYGNEGLDFVSFQFRPRSMNSSCTTVPYVQVFHRSRWNPSTPYNTHFYFQDSISNLDVN